MDRLGVAKEVVFPGTAELSAEEIKLAESSRRLVLDTLLLAGGLAVALGSNLLKPEKLRTFSSMAGELAVAAALVKTPGDISQLAQDIRAVRAFN